MPFSRADATEAGRGGMPPISTSMARAHVQIEALSVLIARCS